MKARRFFTALGILAVTAVAGAISYRHQSHLAVTHGQPEALAAIWPACVDGLVAVTGIAISTDRAAGYRPRLWALVGFWIGVVVSVATNWLATPGGLIAHAVSAFPAVAFLVAVESLSSKPRPRKGTASPVPTDEAAAKGVATVNTPARMQNRTAPEMNTASDIPSDSDSRREQPKRPVRRTPRQASTADRVAAARKRTPDAPAGDIARRLGVTTRTVQRHLSALDVTDTPGDIYRDTEADTRPHNGSTTAVTTVDA